MMRRSVNILFLLLLVSGLPACAPEDGGSFEKAYANRVVSHRPVLQAGITEADWPYFFHPENALGAPGDYLTVVSLGYDPAAVDSLGGSLILGLGSPDDPAKAHCIIDGEGADFAVYENPFVLIDPGTGGRVLYTELATVEVSADLVNWYLFPPAVVDSLPLDDPARYPNFAGVTPATEGGDAFDLAEVITAHGLASDYQGCYVRITDGGTRYPDYGNTQTDLHASGADINAVELFHGKAVGALTP